MCLKLTKKKQVDCVCVVRLSVLYAGQIYGEHLIRVIFIMSGDEALPVVMAIVRGNFGRHAWTMQLRHQSRSHKVSFVLFAICKSVDILT